MTDDELAEAVVDGLSGIFETGYYCSGCPSMEPLLGYAGRPIWCRHCEAEYPGYMGTPEGTVASY